MGQLVFGVIGAVVGGYFGGPAGAQAGFALGSAVGGLVFPAGSDQSYTGPRMSDLTVSSSTYGAPIVEGIGTQRIGGNIIWCPGIEEVETTTTQSAGKGGGPSVTQTTYSYYASFALALCKGPKSGVLRIWADGTKIYDASSSDYGAIDGLTYRFYNGDSTQLPDSIIEAREGVGNVPAFRGLCYLVFDRMPLAKFGNRIPSLTVEIADSVATNFSHVDGPAGRPMFPVFAFDEKYQRYITAENIGISSDVAMAQYDANTMQLIRVDRYTDLLNNNPSYPNAGVGNGTWYSDGGDFFCLQANSNTVAILRTSTMQVEAYSHAVGIPGWPTTTSVSGTERSALGGIEVSGNTDSGPIFFWPSAFKDLLYIMDKYGVLQGVDDIEGYSLAGKLSAASGLFKGGQAILWIAVASGTSLGLDTMYFNRYSIAPSVYDFVDPDIYPVGAGTPFPLVRTHHFTKTLADFGWTADSCSKFDIVYDPLDGNYLCIGVCWMGASRRAKYAKYDFENQALVWTIDNTTDGDAAFPNYASNSWSTQRCRQGQFALASEGGRYITVIDTRHGTYTNQDWLTGTAGAAVPSFGTYFSAQFGSVFAFGTKTTIPTADFAARFDTFHLQGGPAAIVPYIASLCQRCGLEPADVDTSGILVGGQSPTVWGYYWNRAAVAKDLIGPLAQKFFFDAFESDFTLKFQNRGQGVVETIPQELLAFVDEGQGLVLDETIAQEKELPAKVTLTYTDYQRDYQGNAQISVRPSNPKVTMSSNNQTSLESPVAQTATEAKQLVERILYTTWMERSTYKLQPSNRYMYFDPTDEFIAQLADGTTIQMRLTKYYIGQDLTLQWEAVGEDGATYSSNAITDGGQIPVNVLPRVVASVMFVMDLPLLQDLDNRGRERTFDYVVMSGVTETGWRGAYAYLSPDNTTYAPVVQSNAPGAYGSAVTALPDNLDPFSLDTTTSFDVVLQVGEDRLVSVTTDELLAGKNGMAVKCSNGEWEVIQFQTVTPQANGVYRLTNLLRGRVGTDWVCGLHAVGDQVVLLESATAQYFESDLATIGVTRYWKPVSYGQFIDNVAPQAETTRGNELKPWMPRQLKATVAGSDIGLTWARRTRYGGGLQDGTGTVPLNEDSEAYEVDILSGPGGTLKRTLSGLTTPAATYNSADITTDFGSIPATLTMRVYQLTQTSGLTRGFSREITVTVS